MFSRTLLAVLLTVVPATPVARAGEGSGVTPYDLLIRNARIVDGTGGAWYRGDLAVRGDTIVAIDRHLAATATRTIDAHDQVLAPGFIDLHTHSGRGIFEVPAADNYVRQGVTTLFEGPDGRSSMPLRDFFARLEARKIGPNMASFVGQGTVREKVVGMADRPAVCSVRG